MVCLLCGGSGAAEFFKFAAKARELTQFGGDAAALLTHDGAKKVHAEDAEAEEKDAIPRHFASLPLGGRV